MYTTFTLLNGIQYTFGRKEELSQQYFNIASTPSKKQHSSKN